MLSEAMGHGDPTEAESGAALVAAYAEAWEECVEDLQFLPGQAAYGLDSVAPSSERLAARQEEANRLRKQAEVEDKQTRKLEQKMKVQLHGYQVRHATLILVLFASTLLPRLRVWLFSPHACASFRPIWDALHFNIHTVGVCLGAHRCAPALDPLPGCSRCERRHCGGNWR